MESNKGTNRNFRRWWASGAPGIWMSGGAVAIAVIMTRGLLALIAVRGLAHFWPAEVIEARYQVPGQEARTLLGERVEDELVPRARLAASGLPVAEEGGELMSRQLFKVGNRELFGADFSWVIGEWLDEQARPAQVTVLERREWGNFYGYLVDLRENGAVVAEGEAAWAELPGRLARVEQLQAELRALHRGEIGGINHGLERLRLEERRLQLDGELDDEAQARLAAARADHAQRYQAVEARLAELNQALARDSVSLRASDGRVSTVALGKVVRAYRPNAMSTQEKWRFYGSKLWEFVSG